jgi:aspartyl-tRNA(Asn)/glutamyl-tRNA(Gln) amidotransferase subunit B
MPKYRSFLFLIARIIFTLTYPRDTRYHSYDHSLARGGYLELPIPASADPNGKGYVRAVHIHKLHIEEDAGKTKKERNRRYVDFNRCGVPLVEMVTEPDLRTAEEAGQYLIRLRQLLRWLGISKAIWKKATCAAMPTFLSRKRQAVC